MHSLLTVFDIIIDPQDLNKDVLHSSTSGGISSKSTVDPRPSGITTLSAPATSIGSRSMPRPVSIQNSHQVVVANLNDRRVALREYEK